MDLSAYISFLVKADISDVTAPVFVLTDNSVYPSGVVPTGIFTITQPDTVTRAGVFTAPDIADGTLSTTIALRLNTAGKLQCGQYTIKYEVSADGYVPTTLVRSFTVNYTQPTIALKEIFDLFTPALEYEDDTNYAVTGFTQTVVRSWQATIGTVGTLTGTNSASFDLKYGGSYYDAAYSIDFTADITYQSSSYSFFSIVDKLTKMVGTDAYTPPTSAQLLTYLTTLKTRLDALINSCQKYDTAKADYEYAYILYTHAMKRICDQDSIGVNTYIQEIVNIVNNNVATSRTHTNTPILPYVYDCDCGCGDGSGGSGSEFSLEVVAGTADAIAAGVLVGSLTFSNIYLVNKQIEVVRGSVFVPGVDPLNGGQYFTKVLTNSTVTFSTPIQNREYIRITALRSVSAADSFSLEVVAGQSAAIAEGINVGATTFVNDAIAGKKIEVIKGGIPLPGIDPLNGGDFYTKTLASNTITFSSIIQDSEYIKINTI